MNYKTSFLLNTKDDKPRLKLELVGLREKGDDCGHVREAGSCGDYDHDLKYRNIACNKKTCSNCWYFWRSRQVHKTVERLNAVEHIYDKLPKKDIVDLQGNVLQKGVTKLGNCKHVMVSPDQEYARERLHNGVAGFKELRRKYNKIIQEHGIKGAVTIPHLFRVRDEFKEKFRSDHNYDKEQGIWKWLREKDLLTQEDKYYKALKLAPHFHLLAYGKITRADKFAEETGKGSYWELGNNYAGLDGENNRFITNTKKEAKKKVKENETPWTYKNIGYRTTAEEKIKQLFYLLSHTQIIGRKNETTSRYPVNLITYSGTIAYQELSMKEAKDQILETCGNCGQEIYELYRRGWDEQIKIDEDRTIYKPTTTQNKIDKYLSDEVMQKLKLTRTYKVKDQDETYKVKKE